MRYKAINVLHTKQCQYLQFGPCHTVSDDLNKIKLSINLILRFNEF